jgi:hypothetical protein
MVLTARYLPRERKKEKTFFQSLTSGSTKQQQEGRKKVCQANKKEAAR